MKVEKVEKIKVDTFDELEVGDVFMSRDMGDEFYYLKIDGDEKYEFNAFSFEENENVFFDSGELVIKVNAKVVIE